MADTGVKVVLGGGMFASPKCPTPADVKAWCDAYRAHGHNTIDVAKAYPIEAPGEAEKICGKAGVTATFVMDTKAVSMGVEKAHGREQLTASIKSSMEAFGFKAGGDGKGGGMIDVMYLHIPCLDVPFEETVEVMNEAHQKGWFKRFGISNFSPKRVEEICEIAIKNGWIQPTVYQGHYNPISRKGEKDLFPVLRKYGIAFYAYSPTGAGIFSGKVTADSFNKPTGRFSHTNGGAAKMYTDAYLRTELLEAGNRVNTAAKKHGINGHEAALRWCIHHCILRKEHGDAVIFGASSLGQLQENLKYCDGGPLPEDLVKMIDDIWVLAEPVAPWSYLDI